jgi:hypothetical protein
MFLTSIPRDKSAGLQKSVGDNNTYNPNLPWDKSMGQLNSVGDKNSNDNEKYSSQ